MEKRRVVLKIELSPVEYKALEAIARSQGYELPSHLVESLVRGIIKGQVRPQPGPQTQVDVDLLARRLRRVVEDILNPYTGKIDEILRKLGELLEAIEALQQAPQPEAPPPPPPQPAPVQYQRGEARRRGSRAMERLRRDGILVASEATWINEPERFFAHLKRMGAIVIDTGEDTVAVHPEFWEEFKRVLEETAVRSREEVRRLLETSLGEAAVKLFDLLSRAGLVYYDEERASWVVNA